MAESFPSTIAANILTEIDFLTSSDSGLSSRIRKEITKAKEILVKGKAVLMKAEAQQLHNCELQDGLEKLSELLYDAEDLLDELKCEVLGKQVGKLNIVKYYLKIKVTRKRLDEKIDNIRSISIAVKDPDTKLVSSGENLSFLGNARHFSFLGIANGNKKVPSISNNLRTIIMQSLQPQRVAESFVSKWISNFKCLWLLCLSGLQFKELPDSVAALKHLRFLDLSWNSDLEKLYDTICKLLRLQTLKLRGCSALKNLPRNIQKMISLRHLELTIQWERLPPIGAECFKSLQYLHLYKCKNLESLREGMESLTTIRTLILQGCGSLTTLPDNVKLLETLEKLVISSCPKLNLKMDLQGKDLSLKLKAFMIYELKELEDLPQLILQGSANTLKYIRIEECPKLTELPAWLASLTALQKLEIVSCSGLSSLSPGMEKLTALRELKIQKSPPLSESCRRKPLNILNLESHLDPEVASSSRDNE
ncbi:hypothetical protein Pint_11861 [Pistacia integerrima]|uniref:Uncharacterized protein n=1 Tax=Pistacia integerrima TaxID=434235 RepID=A0ACC0XJZ0_9ROSI|nr:hypothetical protein Pint_11861 [Pistacia integerrima]